MKESIERLLKTVEKSTSPYHTVLHAEEQLAAAGFHRLQWESEWQLQRGGCYYVSPFRSTLLAFRVNPEFHGKEGVRIITSHVDTPGLRIKANPEYPSNKYQRVNVEVYGGAIYNTWMDRPLGVAGMIWVRNHGGHPEIRYYDSKRPLFLIPNLSIHMNRDLNKGVELNPQLDLLPIGGVADPMPDKYFLSFLGEELHVPPEEIISYDLCLYIMQPGCVCGIRQDMVTAPRLDNLTSVQASLTALMSGSRKSGMDLIALFDHEEIGSRSKNGAGGNLLPFILERIYGDLEISRKEYLKSVVNSFLISADVAHALNPNHPEKYDPTSAVQINDGVVIKCTSKQTYAGDSEAWAILKDLGQRVNVPCSFNYGRSDIPGGSTLGSILSAALPMRSADIGAPLLAMHSAMETMGYRDQYYLEQYLMGFLYSYE